MGGIAECIGQLALIGRHLAHEQVVAEVREVTAVARVEVDDDVLAGLDDLLRGRRGAAERPGGAVARRDLGTTRDRPVVLAAETAQLELADARDHGLGHADFDLVPHRCDSRVGHGGGLAHEGNLTRLLDERRPVDDGQCIDEFGSWEPGPEQVVLGGGQEPLVGPNRVAEFDADRALVESAGVQERDCEFP